MIRFTGEEKDLKIFGPEEMRICKFCQRHVGFFVGSEKLGQNGQELDPLCQEL